MIIAGQKFNKWYKEAFKRGYQQGYRAGREKEVERLEEKVKKINKILVTEINPKIDLIVNYFELF